VRILFLVAVGVVGWLLYRLYFGKLLAQGRLGRVKIGLVALGLVFLGLAVTGRAPALFAVLGALMTQAMRLLPVLVRFAPSLAAWLGPSAMGQGTGKGTGKGAGPRVSHVHTRTLHMSLDQDSGAMHGEVLEGPFAGRGLEGMSGDELQALHEECRRDDHDALRLLEAWLVRERPEDWASNGKTGAGAGESAGGGDTGGGAGGGNSGPMSVQEAGEVLGVDPTADRDEIVAAHRTLMSRLHPDKGGSHYLATKVNEARQVLLDNR